MTGTPQYILAPYLPTPHKVVDRMLEIAAVTDKDFLYDLGCGDGRMLIAAANRYGARGVGIDIAPYWIEDSRQKAQAAGVAELVRFEVEDTMSMDYSLATVFMLYPMGWSTERLMPIILGQVREGTRIVSHSFSAGDWEARRVETCRDEEGVDHNLYLWVK